MLTAFIWLLVIYHAIGLLGSIEILSSRSPSSRTGWQIGGTVFHAIVILWGGFLLWLLHQT